VLTTHAGARHPISGHASPGQRAHSLPQDLQGPEEWSADPPAATGTEPAKPARRKPLEERERIADVREREANEREALADQRERKGDEREREADRREAALNQRQREIDERERELDEHRRALGEAVESLEQRALETVERSRALLALSGQRVGRHTAAVKRVQAHRERQQAELGRAVAEIRREHAAVLPDPSEAIKRARVLREQAIGAMEALAANEDQIARIHEELAASLPERRGEYQRTAEQARAGARRARELVRKFTA
jgi:hypothetical protein